MPLPVRLAVLLLLPGLGACAADWEYPPAPTGSGPNANAAQAEPQPSGSLPRGSNAFLAPPNTMRMPVLNPH